jgi:osmoprotectant transport system permease protein
MEFLEFLADEYDDLLALGIEHIKLVVWAVGIGTVLSVALGIATYRTDRPRQAVLAVTGIFLTIPSIALFGLMIPIFGLSFRSSLVPLIMYSLLPIVRNTITGLNEVDPAIVESAKGMGMSGTQRLFRIELPLAWPVIITGIRVSTVIIVGIAAIAALINGPGLGHPIFDGLRALGSVDAINEVLSATIGVVIVAILFDAVFNVIGKLTTSRGIR